MPRINFKATESGDFTPYPNDTYLFTAEAVEIRKASTGTDMLNVTFRCVQPGGEFDNRKHWERFALLPQSGWRLKNFLEAFDVPHTAMPGAGKGEFDIDFDTDDIVGKAGLIELEQEVYVVMKNGVQQIDPETGKPKTAIRSNGTKFSKAA